MIIFIYILAITVANLTIAQFGPWVSPINSFLLIGLDMVLRDKLHDKWVGNGLLIRMTGLIVAAGIISFLLNPATLMISVASSVAFGVAMIVNSIVYQMNIKNKWLIRSNVSNTAGSAVDSLLFPTIAFGVIMPEIIILQFTAKVVGGFMWSLLFNKKKV